MERRSREIVPRESLFTYTTIFPSCSVRLHEWTDVCDQQPRDSESGKYRRFVANFVEF